LSNKSSSANVSNNVSVKSSLEFSDLELLNWYLNFAKLVCLLRVMSDAKTHFKNEIRSWIDAKKIIKRERTQRRNVERCAKQNYDSSKLLTLSQKDVDQSINSKFHALMKHIQKRRKNCVYRWPMVCTCT
jgi:hypothetical protein